MFKGLYERTMNWCARHSPVYRQLTEKLNTLEEKIANYQKEEIEQQKGESVLELDERGNIVRVNPLCEQLLGYKESELEKQHIKFLEANGESIDCLALMETLGHERFKFSGVRKSLDIKTKDGERKLDVNVEILYQGKDGEYSGAVLIFDRIGKIENLRRMLSIKRQQIHYEAPEVFDEEYKQVALSEICVKSVKGNMSVAYIDLQNTREITEDAARSLIGLVTKENPVQIYLKNVSQKITDYLISKGFPKDHIKSSQEQIA